MQGAWTSQEEFLKHAYFTQWRQRFTAQDSGTQTVWHSSHPSPLMKQRNSINTCRKISAGSCCAHPTGCRHWGRSQHQGLAAGMVWNSKEAQANRPGLMPCAWHFGSVSCSHGMKEACGSPWWCGDGRSSVYLRSTWDPTIWLVEAVWGLWGFSWFAVDTGSYILQTAVLSMVQLCTSVLLHQGWPGPVWTAERRQRQSTQKKQTAV